MPPVSEKQRRFMRWAAENPKASGVSKKVSGEFNKADPGGKLPGEVKEGKPVKGVPRSPGKRKKRNWYDHARSKG